MQAATHEMRLGIFKAIVDPTVPLVVINAPTQAYEELCRSVVTALYETDSDSLKVALARRAMVQVRGAAPPRIDRLIPEEIRPHVPVVELSALPRKLPTGTLLFLEAQSISYCWMQDLLRRPREETRMIVLGDTATAYTPNNGLSSALSDALRVPAGRYFERT